MLREVIALKKLKVVLGLTMAIVMVLGSIVPAFAIDTISSSVINDDLSEVMKNSKGDDKIKVCLWYKDIDQEEVDTLTTKATGLTPESCAVIQEFPPLELIQSCKSDELDAESKMQDYLSRTKSYRESERKLAEKYSKKHMEISNEKYNTKSENIRKTLSIDDSNVIFSSELAPMIIAELTKSEIKRASKNIDIEQISLYIEPEMLEETSASALETSNVDMINGGSIFGLTGEGVELAIIENNRVYLSGDIYPEVVPTDTGKPSVIEINDSEGLDYGNVVLTNSALRTSKGLHATRVANIVLSIAPETRMYCGIYNLSEIESLVKYGVKLFNISLGDVISENSPNYVYTDFEKWFDYLIANHGVTVINSAGNTGDSINPRVTEPGLAYNIITVGAYAQAHSIENLSSIDEYMGASSYKNSLGYDLFGCEKPDVVMPCSFYSEGYNATSYAAPHLTGIVALMYELKPSLQNMPHLVKAIIIASCHSKVYQKPELEGPEYIETGITDRQGAGAPDAWIMASIICQGSYGSGMLGGTDTKINIVQPPYGAENINFSVAWLRDNYIEDEALVSTLPKDVTLVQASNIGLSIYKNNSVIGASNLANSSTEMCYVNINNYNDFNYQLRLTQHSYPINLRYAYAWSTDDMYAPTITNGDGIYHIKNTGSGRYVVYDTSAVMPNLIMRTVNSLLPINETHKWIIEYNKGSCNISTGYGTDKLYLGQSTTLSGTSYAAQLNQTPYEIYIQNNEDGTISFLNANKDRILTYSGANLVWAEYNLESPSLPGRYKWCLDKVNYLYGDIDMNGDLTTNEVNGVLSMNNLQKFLADINKDGVVNYLDVSLTNNFVINKYI